MSIKKIEVNNYLSHKETEIQLHDGMNVIVGDPRSGKSAIVRALKWLFFNNPKGYKFHSNFTDDPTKVSVELKEGIEVSKIRSETETKFFIDENEYTGGQQTPDEVIRVLNINDINLAGQFDPPFLVTASPGEVAREINKICRLEDAEGWVGELTTTINSKNKEVGILNDQIKEYKEKERDLSYVEELEKFVIEAEEMLNYVTVYKKKIDNLQRALSVILEVEEKIDGINEVVQYEYLIDDALHLFRSLNKEKQNIEMVKNFIKTKKELDGCKEEVIELVAFYDKALKYFTSIQECNRNIENVKLWIKLHSKIYELDGEIKTVSLVYASLKVYLDDLRKEGNMVKSLKQYIIDIEQIKKEIIRKDIALEDLIDEYHADLEELSICPFCYSKIDNQKINTIINQVRG